MWAAESAQTAFLHLNCLSSPAFSKSEIRILRSEMSPSTSSQARGSCSPSSRINHLSLSEEQLQIGATVTGDRELLWRRIRETDSLQSLLVVVEEAGFHPVVLPRSTLLREGVISADFGAILGQLGVFGAILDCKTAAELMQRELVRREINLVKLGVSKQSINLLLRHLQLARNVSKAVCLVIDDRAPPATTAKSVFAPLEESRHLGLLSGGHQLPAIIFGCSESGTVTRIEDRDSDASSISSSSGDDQTLAAPSAEAAGELLQMQHKRCNFTDMMLVAFESNCQAAA